MSQKIVHNSYNYTSKKCNVKYVCKASNALNISLIFLKLSLQVLHKTRAGCVCVCVCETNQKAIAVCKTTSLGSEAKK